MRPSHPNEEIIGCLSSCFSGDCHWSPSLQTLSDFEQVVEGQGFQISVVPIDERFGTNTANGSTAIPYYSTVFFH